MYQVLQAHLLKVLPKVYRPTNCTLLFMTAMVSGQAQNAPHWKYLTK